MNGSKKLLVSCFPNSLGLCLVAAGRGAAIPLKDVFVFLSIGTSGVVEPAASLPLVALRRGARVALVNPEETPLLSETVDFLRGPAGTVLPMLLQETWLL